MPETSRRCGSCVTTSLFAFWFKCGPRLVGRGRGRRIVGLVHGKGRAVTPAFGAEERRRCKGMTIDRKRRGSCHRCKKAGTRGNLRDWQDEDNTGLCAKCYGYWKDVRGGQQRRNTRKAIDERKRRGKCRRCERVGARQNLRCWWDEDDAGLCAKCYSGYWNVASREPCAACRRPLPPKATPGTWCASCGFPPCNGCGASRPRGSKYHARVLPHWSCRACAAPAAPKQCRMCSKELHKSCREGSWCSSCAFPPCLGCGRPRPRGSTYHARYCTEWWCQPCLLVERDLPEAQRHRPDDAESSHERELEAAAK